MHTTPTEEKSNRHYINLPEIIARNLGLKKLETAKGKKIGVVKNARGDFEIQFSSGGEKPKEFQGKFTTMKAITEAIDLYLNRKSDAKTESSKATN